MPIVEDNQNYEDWLRKQCQVVEPGLEKKHKRMEHDALMFFRATCFRFARKIADVLGNQATLLSAPVAPSVGDAHFENFGTWRDAEGRLVWGVNDFDDVADLPYTFDLIRLATSFALEPDVPGDIKEQVYALLKGYRRGLSNPGPCIADDDIPWMHRLVTGHETRPGVFERDLEDEISENTQPSEAEQLLLRGILPAGTTSVRFGSRQKGGGSLGRPRFVAFGSWNGGIVAREIKAIVPSSWSWAGFQGGGHQSMFNLATGSFRSPDPFFRPVQGFIARRIASDSSKIDLSSAPARDFTSDVVEAMGRELGSIHSAGPLAALKIKPHLGQLPDDWLLRAVEIEVDQVQSDFSKWRSR